ncbi:MAG: hypothetical protein ACJ718_02260, partial [Nitrososphaeraceae archaeon]
SANSIDGNGYKTKRTQSYFVDDMGTIVYSYYSWVPILGEHKHYLKSKPKKQGIRSVQILITSSGTFC